MSWIESRRPTHLVCLTLFSFQRSTSSEVSLRFVSAAAATFILYQSDKWLPTLFKSFFRFRFSKSFSSSFIVTYRLLFVKNFFEVFFDRIKLRKLFFFNDSVILSCHHQHVNNYFSSFFNAALFAYYLKQQKWIYHVNLHMSIYFSAYFPSYIWILTK